jgi:integrase
MKPKVLNNTHGEVRIYKVKRNSFEVRYKVGKNRKRETRRSLEEAEKRANEVLNHFAECQEPIDSRDLQMFQYLRQKCEKHGTDLMEVWEFWESNAKKSEHPIGQVVVDFLDDQIGRKVSPTTVRTNRARLVPLVASFGDGKFPIEQITTKLLDEWLVGSFENPTTRKNHRAMIVQLWRWATKKEILPNQQFTAADQTTVPMAPNKDPEIYTPEEMRLMFQHVHAHYPSAVPALLLAAFSGVRNAEIHRLRWEHISLTDGIVMLPSEITKTGRRRVATIPPDALETMKRWHKAFRPHPSEAVAIDYTDREISKARKALGIKLRTNGFRKSFVSHAVAFGEKSVDKIAEECGHAVAVLQSTYKGLVDKESAERWFQVPQSA